MWPCDCVFIPSVCSPGNLLLCMKVSNGPVGHVSPQPPLTHPYKAGREPSLLLINLAPPPVLVGSVQHLYDIAGLKSQLPIRHGHMVPYRLSVDNRASTYQLRVKDRGSALFYSDYIKTLQWNTAKQTFINKMNPLCSTKIRLHAQSKTVICLLLTSSCDSLLLNPFDY